MPQVRRMLAVPTLVLALVLALVSCAVPPAPAPARVEVAPSSPLAVAPEPKSRGFINLDEPGALSQLRDVDAPLHDKVLALLAAFEGMDEAGIDRTLRVTLKARDFHWQQTLLTSYPAQKRLRFTLDKTQFQKTLLIFQPGARIYPAR